MCTVSTICRYNIYMYCIACTVCTVCTKCTVCTHVRMYICMYVRTNVRTYVGMYLVPIIPSTWYLVCIHMHPYASVCIHMHPSRILMHPDASIRLHYASERKYSTHIFAETVNKQQRKIEVTNLELRSSTQNRSGCNPIYQIGKKQVNQQHCIVLFL